MKAIVIDDLEEMRYLLTDILEDMGWQVSGAENCKLGLDTLQNQPDTDLVLVDWRTPEMTGIEFVKAVRDQASLNNVKLIMVTGLSEVNEVVEAISAGANEYLMKPCTKDMLVDKLKLVGFDS